MVTLRQDVWAGHSRACGSEQVVQTVQDMPVTLVRTLSKVLQVRTDLRMDHLSELTGTWVTELPSICSGCTALPASVCSVEVSLSSRLRSRHQMLRL